MNAVKMMTRGRVWPNVCHYAFPGCYRNTLDRCCVAVQTKGEGRLHSGCSATRFGVSFFRRVRDLASPLGRKTTALQNQGEQLRLSQLVSSQMQTLLFSNNGSTDSGASESDLETHTEAVMMAALEKKLGSTFSKRSTLPSPKPLLIVISGPSGVGKDAVINRLQEIQRDMHFVVTATTRPRREGEVDGKDYIFMNKEKFEELIERDELLEHALVYGDYKGIPKQQVRKALSKGTDVVLRLDVQGAATIRELVPESLSIFLVAENERALVRRLLGRKTEPLDRALVRVETARQETKRIAEFDYVVENPSGKLEETVGKICSIIEAEKLRMQQKAIRI